MKKIILFVLIFLPVIVTNAQWDLSAAMGLDLKYAPSYRDYINFAFAPGGNKLSSFTTAIDFSGEAGYGVSQDFQLGIEYGIQIDSYNSSIGPGGIYELSYTAHRPSLLAYYVIPGEGFKLKFGGGLGLRYVSIDEKIISSTNYSTTGIGIIFKADGNTMLGKNLFALIGVNLRYDITGEPASSEGQKIMNPGTGEFVNMNSISVGIKLGITYTF